jgi:hypothetical protein
MKVECPICHIKGFLEVRGSNYRVKHYQGYENGKRRYFIHSFSKEQGINVGINDKIGNQSMEIKKENLPFKWCGGWDLNPRTSTGQPPQGCAFGHAWQPPLAGCVFLL